MGEIWVLGGTGRSGRSVASSLAAAGVTPVLVGRDQSGLDAVAATIPGGARTITASSVDAMIAEIERGRPKVVVNTIGPFSKTAVPIARACLPSTHYLDLGNDLDSIRDLVGLHDDAVAAGRTLVAGAAFGVLGTESVVLMLCRDRPTPTHVRVDALPAVSTEAGAIGDAMAASIADTMAPGGRRYDHGGVVRTRLGADVAHLTLPDGTTGSSLAIPSGELYAAHIASGAPSVVAGSSAMPTARAVCAILPVVAALMSVTPVRKFVTTRLSAVSLKEAPSPREHSWGHAQVTWPDGTVRDGWLRLGDAQAFTTAVMTEVACRLARGEGKPGAYTPGAAFGPELAVAAGGEFILPEL